MYGIDLEELVSFPYFGDNMVVPTEEGIIEWKGDEYYWKEQLANDTGWFDFSALRTGKQYALVVLTLNISVDQWSGINLEITSIPTC